jgi:nitrate reductase cytochrome c-type subunit
MNGIRRSLVMVVALVSVFWTAAAVRASDVPKTKADHLAVAEKYEKLATEQDAIVKEHTQMKQDYRANQASLPKQTREKSLAEMDEHCDALIQAAKKEADEDRAIAQWHKIRATETK